VLHFQTDIGADLRADRRAHFGRRLLHYGVVVEALVGALDVGVRDLGIGRIGCRHGSIARSFAPRLI